MERRCYKWRGTKRRARCSDRTVWERPGPQGGALRSGLHRPRYQRVRRRGHHRVVWEYRQGRTLHSRGRPGGQARAEAPRHRRADREHTSREGDLPQVGNEREHAGCSPHHGAKGTAMKFLTGLIFGLLLASAVADEIKEYDCPPDGKIIV